MREPGSHLTADDYRSLAQFRHDLRRFMSFSSVAAEAEGLPSQQHQALLAIKAHAYSMTIGDLADWLVIAPHSATELVGRLVEADLVRRETDPADRRRQRILLTTKAEDILHRLTETHLTELRSIAPNLIALLKALTRADTAE